MFAFRRINGCRNHNLAGSLILAGMLTLSGVVQAVRADEVSQVSLRRLKVLLFPEYVPPSSPGERFVRALFRGELEGDTALPAELTLPLLTGGKVAQALSVSLQTVRERIEQKYREYGEPTPTPVLSPEAVPE